VASQNTLVLVFYLSHVTKEGVKELLILKVYNSISL